MSLQRGRSPPPSLRPGGWGQFRPWGQFLGAGGAVPPHQRRQGPKMAKGQLLGKIGWGRDPFTPQRSVPVIVRHSTLQGTPVDVVKTEEQDGWPSGVRLLTDVHVELGVKSKFFDL